MTKYRPERKPAVGDELYYVPHRPWGAPATVTVRKVGIRWFYTDFLRFDILTWREDRSTGRCYESVAAYEEAMRRDELWAKFVRLLPYSTGTVTSDDIRAAAEILGVDLD